MNNPIDSVSYDQYKNIPTVDEMGIKTKIIFSSEAYKKLQTQIKQTADTGIETGCFFIGRPSEEDQLTIFIDYYTSDFQSDDAFVSGGAVNPTQRTYDELNNKIREYNQSSKRASVIHFHAHPRELHYENFSDQDLSLIAKMAYDNRNTNAFGMLGFPIPGSENTNGISIVRPIKPEVVNDIGRANFFRFPNVYYCKDNEIYKIGTFQKQYDGRKYKANSNGDIVKNVVTVSKANDVCAFGVNPNNGEQIVDESVGYIDVNGTFCFPEENLNFNFRKIKEIDEDFER